MGVKTSLIFKQGGCCGGIVQLGRYFMHKQGFWNNMILAGGMGTAVYENQCGRKDASAEGSALL